MKAQTPIRPRADMTGYGFKGELERLMEDHPTRRFFVVYDTEHLYMRIMSRISSDLEHVVDEFKQIDQGAFFAQRYTSRRVEKYNYAVSPFGYFQPGLLRHVIRVLKENKYINPLGEGLGGLLCISEGARKFTADYITPLASRVKEMEKNGEELEISNISLDRNDDEHILTMRPYQLEAIEKIITAGHGRCMVEAATGSGKSFVVANLIYTLSRLEMPKKNPRALIYVPNIQLVEQFYSDLLSYGYKEDELCRCSGSLDAKGKKEFKDKARKAWITIANAAWCNNHLDEIGNVDILVVDEAHRCSVGSRGFVNLRERLFETKVRIGLTGTLPEGYKLWELEGLLGPVVYKASITDLQDAGYLAGIDITKIAIRDEIVEADTSKLFNQKSKVKMNDYNFDTGTIVSSGDAWNDEQDWCAKECERIYRPVMRLLLDDILTASSNTLLLFDRISLGERLYSAISEMIRKEGKEGVFKAIYIDGSTPVNERESVRKALETSDGNLLLGQSAILSTGINIKNLSRIVLLAGGKSQARIVQAIGRTLRLSSRKDRSELIDVEFNYKYSHRHALERKSMYSKWYNIGKFARKLEYSV